MKLTIPFLIYYAVIFTVTYNFVGVDFSQNGIANTLLLFLLCILMFWPISIYFLYVAKKAYPFESYPPRLNVYLFSLPTDKGSVKRAKMLGNSSIVSGCMLFLLPVFIALVAHFEHALMQEVRKNFEYEPLPVIEEKRKLVEEWKRTRKIE